jgi:biotin carboxyl carrier protein
MLRKFRIKINEKEYIVEMEELGVQPGPGPIKAPAPVTAPTPVAAPTLTPAPAPSVPENAEGITMEAPMPGTILDLKVKVGDVVDENQVLLILEAMKMENEIVAPKSGTITGIYVTKGAAIDVSTPMITIA